ncbi:allantoate amidohydrolase [Pseudoclavibacter sp. CFCC 13796]|uniref:allantoate amidohydrolase n=1 Tax=Pseudoclavibacter sp. CFCC 13796 TaxID=2615179 RepID=UPI0013013F4C|nr:allantoate amidohydrolase [Pseudoclavibacter sp. CFCC 13796]KAB1660872.1 allantoate amidohydrolase [Pseudoclavibacter sp. CFCC 13796]
MHISLQDLFEQIDGIGNGGELGYTRLAWTEEDAQLRAWFREQAELRGLLYEVDRAGNQWAWWGGRPTPEDPAITTGSHLDSVPGGGQFDGPLGVLSALAAIDLLRDQGFEPRHPIGIVNTSDEEGARFGIACFGTRVLTGVIDPDQALARADADGITLAEALDEHEIDTDDYGADPMLLKSIACHLELHVEQGYALGEIGSPIAVASHIWPHGRWEVRLQGESNHAGTTPMGRRCDPMNQLADLIVAVRESAVRHDAVATIGRLTVIPNGVNVIAAAVIASLDVRASHEEAVGAVLADLARFAPRRESWTASTYFDTSVSGIVSQAVSEEIGSVPPVLGTGAGHDAGVLQNAGVPTAMLFVRNTTGASHTPAEHADPEDCETGVAALAAALQMMDAGDE